MSGSYAKPGPDRRCTDPPALAAGTPLDKPCVSLVGFGLVNGEGVIARRKTQRWGPIPH